MKGLGRILGAIFVALVALAVISSAYTVREWEQVVITEFGKPVGEPVSKAGLYFRTPFIQEVNRFDKRIMEWDGHRNEVPTADKRFIWIDTTARFRIVDPLLFLQTVRTEAGAQTRLDDVLDSSTRDQISSHRLVETVRKSNRVMDVPRADEGEDDIVISTDDIESVDEGREIIEQRILEGAKGLVAEYGIELIDVRIKRLNYREDVRQAVYARMISERNRIAERYRSEGGGRKAEILGDRAREEKRISSEAERKALEVIATADAEAARIYADAYQADPEFYAFWRSLETYQKVIGDNHTLVISPDSDLYRYFVAPGGK
jgi:membrane protease subunit HflC